MRKIRVLVVDDAIVVRSMVTTILKSDPEIEVVGVAANGKITLAKIETLKPDILTLDIEMPGEVVRCGLADAVLPLDQIA